MTINVDLIDVSITPEFITEQEQNGENHFVFSYTIKIQNNSQASIQLLSRYWLITDANGEQSKVEGEGVIGLQPSIKPQESFTYSSGCLLKTPVGTMQGYYTMIDEQSSSFILDIPVFRLNKPNIMH